MGRGKEMEEDKERHAEGIQVGSAVPKEEEQERKSDGEYNNGNKVRERVQKGVEIETQIEEIIVGRVRTERERLRIVWVYVNVDMERILQNTGNGWRRGKRRW